MDGEREEIRSAFPATRSLLGFVVQMNRDPFRSPSRAVANLEFHHTGEQVSRVGSRIVSRLQALGHRAIDPSLGFPIDLDNFPGKVWMVSPKRVAEAAGLGRMGNHRNLIHPCLGNFILLGTIVTDLEADPGQEDRIIDQGFLRGFPCSSSGRSAAASMPAFTSASAGRRAVRSRS